MDTCGGNRKRRGTPHSSRSDTPVDCALHMHGYQQRNAQASTGNSKSVMWVNARLSQLHFVSTFTIPGTTTRILRLSYHFWCDGAHGSPYDVPYAPRYSSLARALWKMFSLDGKSFVLSYVVGGSVLYRSVICRESFLAMYIIYIMIIIIIIVVV